MRTTIRLDPDVLQAAEELRREQHIGLSEAVNHLARAGLPRTHKQQPFRQRTRALDLRVDVSNIADALEQLDDGPR